MSPLFMMIVVSGCALHQSPRLSSGMVPLSTAFVMNRIESGEQAGRGGLEIETFPEFFIVFPSLSRVSHSPSGPAGTPPAALCGR